MSSFNQRAADERRNNDKHIERRDGVVIVDTSKAKFHGSTLSGLNAEGRRKFENALVIENAMQKGKPIKVIYR